MQRQGDGGDPGPVSSPSPSSPGARGCPWTPKGRWAGRPPAPPAWRRRQPPSCWLSSPGWCHPRGTKVSAGVYGRSGAPGGRQPAGSRSLRGARGGEGWREGYPGTAMPAKASVPAGYGEPAGGALWGTGRSGGSAGRHPERSRKPAAPSRPCLRESSFPADSLLPRGPSAGRCLLDGALRSTPLPCSQAAGSKIQSPCPVWGGFPLPCSPSPSPCHAASTAGWGCSYELAPGEK